MYLTSATPKGISYMSSPVGKDPQQTRKFSGMSLPNKTNCKCQRVFRIIISVALFGIRYYYLCDAGYPNAEKFLVPYRGQLYHLQECRGDGNTPTTAKEYFNMKHSSTQNVIEYAFGILKSRWTILRGKSYYPL
ncbi:hypothetical protein IC582_005230 [Cucumis melo]